MNLLDKIVESSAEVDDPEFLAVWNEMARAVDMAGPPPGRGSGVHHRRPCSPTMWHSGKVSDSSAEDDRRAMVWHSARVVDSATDDDDQERSLLGSARRAGDSSSSRQKAPRFVQCIEKYFAAFRVHLKLVGRKLRASAKSIRVRHLPSFTGLMRRGKSKKMPREDDKSLHCLGRLTWANVRSVLEDMFKLEDELVASVGLQRSLLYYA